ncbi:MAG TPA: class I SAM-dependent methyltransferase [Egibacteraceae bacterium]|nr:class I SAM-dependent methyltransferase [Egibacteraceae bacterium]
MHAGEWDRRYLQAELVWSAEPNRLFAEETADLPAGRALDLACGEGRNAVWLACRGWDVTGVDFSQVALGKAQRLAEAKGAQVRWIRSDLLDYRPDPLTFDLVAVLYLHVPARQRREALARAADALAPGGTIIVIGHDLENLTRGHGGPSDPSILLTPESVAADLTALEIVRAATVVRRGEEEGRPWEALDTFVRATRTASSA